MLIFLGSQSENAIPQSFDKPLFLLDIEKDKTATKIT